MDVHPPTMTIFVHEFVTGGGLAGSELPASWSAEGGAMRRALAEDFASLPGARVVMTLDHRLPDEPGPWTILRVGPGEEPETFRRMAAEADRTALIAPETAGILRERAGWIEQEGGRSLGSSPSAIALTGDKLRLAEHLRGRGVPTPPSRRVVPAEGLPEDVGYPAVLKPIDGAGSVDTYFIETPDACPEAALHLSEALIQPFVEGVPMSASVLMGPRPGGQGETVRLVMLGHARQRIERRGGRFAYRGGAIVATPSFDPEQAETLRRALLSVEGLRGFVGIDFLWHSALRQTMILEINPRPTTSYVGLRRLRSPGELARAWLAVLDEASDVDGNRTRIPPIPVIFDADGTLRSEEAS